MRNRDALRAQILVLQSQSESSVKDARFRVEQELSMYSNEQKRYRLEIEDAQKTIKELILERDALKAKIKYNVSGK